MEARSSFTGLAGTWYYNNWRLAMNNILDRMSGYSTAPETDLRAFELKVGNQRFAMSHWKDAILTFLFAYLKGDTRGFADITISFGEVDLKLDLFTEEFSATGTTRDQKIRDWQGQYSLRVKRGRLEVMDALARFAKDRLLGLIVIDFPDGGELALWRVRLQLCEAAAYLRFESRSSRKRPGTLCFLYT
jgi:hypothetical protein